MRTTNLLFISVLAISITGFCSVPLPAQEAVPSSGTDMKDMKPQMEQMDAQMKEMRTQMVQLQALMKDSMDKMAAAEAAMKTHMETEQSSMKSQMALQHAVIDHLQTMADHMQAMANCMAMMPGPTDMHKKTGEKMKKEKGMMGDQK